MWVVELEQIVPVALVEAGQRREDEDSLAVFYRGARRRDVVELVPNDGRRDTFSILAGSRLAEGRGGR